MALGETLVHGDRMPSVTQRITTALSPKPARARIEEAHSAAVLAHQVAVGKRQRAAYEAVSTDDPKARDSLDAADRTLAEAERQLQITSEARAELGVIEAKDEAARKLAAETAVDRKARQACDQASAATKTFEAAIKAYAEAYAAWTRAIRAAEGQLVATPRSRPDLRHPPFGQFAADEIIRVSAGDHATGDHPPGANLARVLTGSHLTLRPISAEVADFLNAATAGLRK